MTPTVNGRLHHFAEYGLYNGLFLMGDHETISYWNHITGECLHGQLKGAQLEVGPLHYLTAAQTLEAYPNAQIAISNTLPLWRRLFSRIQRYSAGRKEGFLPPRFRGTMGTADSRRPRMEMGLGVWTKKTRRYYPLKTVREQADGLIDKIDGRSVLISMDPISHSPTAVYQDGEGERPLQMFTRWYGFAYTFPGCEIYGE